MKTTGKITGVLLIVFLVFNMPLNAQRGMSGITDSTKAGRFNQKQLMDQRHINGMRGGMGMRPGFAPFMKDEFSMRSMNGMQRGMGNANMQRHGSRFANDRMMGGGPGIMMLESIPNVTDKQKKDITDLRDKQQAEMKKFREDMMAKMQNMRDSYKKNMMNILTDEQKKFIESKQPTKTDSIKSR